MKETCVTYTRLHEFLHSKLAKYIIRLAEQGPILVSPCTLIQYNNLRIKLIELFAFDEKCILKSPQSTKYFELLYNSSSISRTIGKMYPGSHL